MNLLSRHQKVIHLAERHAISEEAVIVAESAVAVSHPKLSRPINPELTLKSSLS